MADHFGDGPPGAERFADFAPQQPAEPVEVAHPGGAVQPQLGADGVQGLLGGALSQDRVRDVARKNLDPEEHEDRHHPDGDDAEDDATEDETRDHAAFSCCVLCAAVSCSAGRSGSRALVACRVPFLNYRTSAVGGNRGQDCTPGQSTRNVMMVEGRVRRRAKASAPADATSGPT